MAEASCIISSGNQVRGALSGSGDLVIEGRVEGHITLDANVTVESGGIVVADIKTEDLTVHGQVNGNTDAAHRISISNGASYSGDLKAPRIVIEDGARFKGTIEMDVPLPKEM